MRIPYVFLLALSLIAPAAAQPVGERQAHAVHCLLAMSAANGTASDATASDAAKMGMLFFTAQLSGIDPALDLAAAARAQLPALTREKVQALLPRCGAEIRESQRKLAALGPALKRTP